MLPDGVEMPETADALWAQIEITRKALGDALAASKKEDVAKQAAILGPLAYGLREKYPALTAERKHSVHHETKAVTHLSSDLSEAAGQGDFEKAKLILNQIDGALKFVKETVTKK